MTTTDGKSMHPGLTLRVYRLNPDTGERTPVRSAVHLLPADEPVYSLAYPPCRCSRCSARGSAR